MFYVITEIEIYEETNGGDMHIRKPNKLEETDARTKIRLKISKSHQYFALRQKRAWKSRIPATHTTEFSDSELHVQWMHTYTDLDTEH